LYNEDASTKTRGLPSTPDLGTVHTKYNSDGQTALMRTTNTIFCAIRQNIAGISQKRILEATLVWINKTTNTYIIFITQIYDQVLIASNILLGYR